MHVVATPVSDTHTGLYMFEITEKEMNALNPQWRSNLVGCTWDGAANMFGNIQGWKTRLGVSVEHPAFTKVLCGAHRLNFSNNEAMSALSETERGWLDKLHSVVRWL